jgi:SpoVK/Ycf46/Vps4 family AAA+-type ATPase
LLYLSLFEYIAPPFYEGFQCLFGNNQYRGTSIYHRDLYIYNKNLEWSYLAGYENVKRKIEDSILLGLTHGEIYDQITQGTRVKFETNRPKAILFEGPPGCGKTTSAKIIANQVNVPLIYMPLEAIMSKWYGESENKFSDIFEAAKALGKSIIFIDEIDALATSREGGIHEATRRILSTLLRKIDGFESDG